MSKGESHQQRSREENIGLLNSTTGFRNWMSARIEKTVMVDHSRRTRKCRQHELIEGNDYSVLVFLSTCRPKTSNAIVAKNAVEDKGPMGIKN